VVLDDSSGRTIAVQGVGAVFLKRREANLTRPANGKYTEGEL
jgi:hypothetical protein